MRLNVFVWISLALLAMTISAYCATAPAKPKAKVKPAAIAKPMTPAQPVIDSKATSMLKQMSDFLATQDDLHVRIDSLTEVIYPSGLKLHTDRAADISAVRPDRLRVTISNADRNVEVFYDGTTATVFTPAKNVYASFNAPPTVGEFINTAQKKYGLSMPAVDILRKDAYNTMMKGVKSASYVGQSMIRGVRTNHLIFRRADMDYEVWIQDGDQPLPMRVIITDKSQKGSPLFAATFTQWDLSPSFASNYFTFVPPSGSSRIAFLQDIKKPALNLKTPAGAGPSK